MNLKVRACFRGPVDVKFPDGAKASGAFVTRRQFDGAQPEIGDQRDSGEFSWEV